LPLAAGSCDVFIGDGCFTTHDFPAGYRAFVDSLHRVLRADGRLLLRFFSRPHVNETADAIFADLDAGRIGSFHALKWRLVMSQHGSLEQGSRLPDVWRAWRERVSDHAALAERSGWPLAVIDTINAYRGVDSGYTFPTRAEIEVSLGTHFAIDGWWTPSYELGDRCPIVLFRPR
jgi:SAM-dependent methyltransferase